MKSEAQVRKLLAIADSRLSGKCPEGLRDVLAVPDAFEIVNTLQWVLDDEQSQVDTLLEQAGINLEEG